MDSSLNTQYREKQRLHRGQAETLFPCPGAEREARVTQEWDWVITLNRSRHFHPKKEQWMGKKDSYFPLHHFSEEETNFRKCTWPTPGLTVRSRAGRWTQVCPGPGLLLEAAGQCFPGPLQQNNRLPARHSCRGLRHPRPSSHQAGLVPQHLDLCFPRWCIILDYYI